MFDKFDTRIKADTPADLTALLIFLLKSDVLALVGEESKSGDLSEDGLALVINPYLTRLFNVRTTERGNVELQFKRENGFENMLLPVLTQWDKLRRSKDTDAMNALESDLLAALK